MDLAEKLTTETMAQLQARARNAADLIAKAPQSEKAARAEELLALIENERARRSLPGNIQTFLEKCPKGFNDPAHFKKERDDKVAASQLCQALLSREAFASGDVQGLLNATRKVINALNLIQGSFEKPKFLDGIAKDDVAPAFIRELEQLLHGPDTGPRRLEAFSDFLHGLGLRKWTYGTYFLFLSEPENYMFVKPEGIKKAVEIAGYPVDYDSAPTAAIYGQILSFARWVEGRLKAEGNPDLVPRDMIDIQSFIWHMAPTGKFAKE
jgi:hypothetical protein